MNWHALFITAVGTLLPAVFMQMFPFWQRTFLFTVRVPEGFAATAPGRRIVRDFRFAAFAISLLCAVAMYAGIETHRSWLIVPAPLLNSVLLIVLLQWARARTLLHAAPPSGTVRRAALGGDEPDQPWWAWAAPLASLAIMGTVAAFVSTHWSELPERFPVHWGIDGQPNRWNTKSLAGVYGVLGVGLAVQAMLAFFLYALTQMKTSPRLRLNQGILAMTSLAIGTLHSAILLLPLRSTAAALPGPSWLWLGLPLVFVAPAVWLAIRLQGSESGEVEPTRDEKWWAGMFYADSSDSRMMVPNRMGAGYSPNLGHPLVRIVVPLWLVSFLGLVTAMR